MPSAFPAAKMFQQSELENYKLQVEILQEKLQRSENDRVQLEDKFYSIERKRNEIEKSLKSRNRMKFKQFLEEQRERNERNKKIVKMLEHIDQQATNLSARSERLKMMKTQYEFYFAKLLQNQAVKHSPRYSILPLTGQPAQTLQPTQLISTNIRTIPSTNYQNQNLSTIGIQTAPNNTSQLDSNNPQHIFPTTPGIFCNDFTHQQRYPSNQFDYFNSQVFLNPLMQQSLQQSALLQIPIQQHQIPPLPLGIPLRTGGIIPVVSPSSSTLIKSQFDDEQLFTPSNIGNNRRMSIQQSSNYLENQGKSSESEFDALNKTSIDLKYRSGSNKNYYNDKTSLKSYHNDDDDNRKLRRPLDDSTEIKQQRRRSEIFDDFNKSRHHHDMDGDEDDEYDEKDSLQQSPQTKSSSKLLSNIGGDGRKDFTRKNKLPNNGEMIDVNKKYFNEKLDPYVIRNEKKGTEYKSNENIPANMKDSMKENFSNLSLSERKPNDSEKYSDGYYLHDGTTSPKPAQHMWNFSGRINDSKPKPEINAKHPLKFEKKEKLSIENIENAIYGELINPSLSDIRDITQMELKTPNQIRPELLRTKLTDFKEIIEPENFEEKLDLSTEKIESPKISPIIKKDIIEKPIIQNRLSADLVPPVNKNYDKQYENYTTEAAKTDSQQIEGFNYAEAPQTSSLPQVAEPDTVKKYAQKQEAPVEQQPKTYNEMPYNQIQYDQSQYNQAEYDPTSAQYDGQQQYDPQQQSQYDNSQYENQQPQYEGQEQLYEGQPYDNQYPEQGQVYDNSEYQNYDQQQYDANYDPNAYQYGYDQQTDQNYSTDPNQQYTEGYDQQNYNADPTYQEDQNYQNYDQTGTQPQQQIPEPSVQTNALEHNLTKEDVVNTNQTSAESPKAPTPVEVVTTTPEAVVAPPPQPVPKPKGSVKPILSKDKSLESENKKKKRVNFIDSSEESSVTQKPETSASESDFDFSTSN